MRIILTLWVATLAAVTAAAEPPKTQVLLVGTYHFANPGQDISNVKAVDVLAEARQRELAQVATSLARFEPTRIAVEWPDALVRERYAKFRDGSLPVSSNEVVQLGFRLAQQRRLPAVLGLDVAGDFPFEAVADWAARHGRQGDIDALIAFGAKETAHISALQERMTIGGVLREMNSPAAIDRAHSFYPPLLAMGDGDDQPGVKLMSAWYTRNLAICARLLESVQAGDRVVVFFGQGHIYLLRQCLREQPGVQLIDPGAYLPDR